MEFSTNPRWRSRNPVRRGHYDKPNWRPSGQNRIGNGPSTVEGRIREQLHDEEFRENNPHLQPGMLVIHQRRARRIIDLREYPADLWPQQFQDEWDRQYGWWLNDPRDRPEPDKATWRDRPVVIVLQDDDGDTEDHRLVPASRAWDVLPEHYAVCQSCGELPPCREEELDKATGRQMAETLRRMAIPAGACMGCGETISGRQKSVAFPGENLARPDLPDGTARFHARRECSEWVRKYREQWESAGKPGFTSAMEQLAMRES
jgi:hypothetical protein